MLLITFIEETKMIYGTQNILSLDVLRLAISLGKDS